jgi:hypothetical protein
MASNRLAFGSGLQTLNGQVVSGSRVKPAWARKLSRRSVRLLDPGAGVDGPGDAFHRLAHDGDERPVRPPGLCQQVSQPAVTGDRNIKPPVGITTSA